MKLRECELAVEQGADEVDIVLALNAFLAGDYEAAAEERFQFVRTGYFVKDRKYDNTFIRVVSLKDSYTPKA